MGDEPLPASSYQLPAASKNARLSNDGRKAIASLRSAAKGKTRLEMQIDGQRATVLLETGNWQLLCGQRSYR